MRGEGSASSRMKGNNMRDLFEEYGLAVAISVLGAILVAGFSFILNNISGMSF